MKKRLFIFAVLTAAFTNSVFGSTWYHFSNNMPFPVKSDVIFEQKDSNGVSYNRKVLKTEVTQPYSVTFSEMEINDKYPQKIIFTVVDGSENSPLAGANAALNSSSSVIKSYLDTLIASAPNAEIKAYLISVRKSFSTEWTLSQGGGGLRGGKRTRAFEIWPLEYANPEKGFYIKELNSQDAENRAILK